MGQFESTGDYCGRYKLKGANGNFIFRYGDEMGYLNCSATETNAGIFELYKSEYYGKPAYYAMIDGYYVEHYINMSVLRIKKNVNNNPSKFNFNLNEDGTSVRIYFEYLNVEIYADINTHFNHINYRSKYDPYKSTFSFYNVDEPTILTDFVYENPTFLNERPDFLNSVNLENHGNDEETQTRTMSYTKKTSSSFKQTYGVKFKADLKISAKIPLFADIELAIGYELSGSWEMQKSVEQSTTVTQEIPLSVKPKHIKVAQIIGTKKQCDIPWKAKLKYSNGYSSIITGIWTGVNTTDIKIIYREYEISGEKCYHDVVDTKKTETQ